MVVYDFATHLPLSIIEKVAKKLRAACSTGGTVKDRTIEIQGDQVAKIRAHTALPIAVGFGISNPEQARLVARDADACVVGSAVVNQIAEHGRSPDLVKILGAFVKSLADAVEWAKNLPATAGQETEIEVREFIAFE